MPPAVCGHEHHQAAEQPSAAAVNRVELIDSSLKNDNRIFGGNEMFGRREDLQLVWDPVSVRIIGLISIEELITVRVWVVPVFNSAPVHILRHIGRDGVAVCSRMPGEATYALWTRGCAGAMPGLSSHDSVP